MNWLQEIDSLVKNHKQIVMNPSRREMIKEVVNRKEALVSQHGALATWTPPASTGRSPLDTVMVRRAESEGQIDWDSPNNLPIEPSTFDMLLEDVLHNLSKKNKLFITDRVVGADVNWALPVKVITDKALSALFTDNMFRPIPLDLKRSVFYRQPYTLLALPYDKLDPKRYQGRLRTLSPGGKTSNIAVAMDLDRRLGVVFGSAYCGSIKKMIFTVMNYYLPAEGILPIHCSANEGPDDDIALLLGLSGTGKTTLSADPRRTLLGDDEHGWNDRGVANFEYGCYAKLIDLDPEKEPEIYKAVFHKAHYLEHGVIVENALMYPDGRFDLTDNRLTPNSRASYPLSYLSNYKEPPVGAHPKTILFLTADANGVLPPVARLTTQQAMLWFLMGYTSKLAGTETGVVHPKTVFSRFFGEPFMPLNPNVYAKMLGDKLQKHGSEVYLVNTGWSAGPFGTGRRMDIRLTREVVQAVLLGALKDTEYRKDPIFHLNVPLTCPGIPNNSVLDPKKTWEDSDAYDERAMRLAKEFSEHFRKAYGDKNIDPAVRDECPGN